MARSEHDEHNIRKFDHIFQMSISLLENHFSHNPTLSNSHNNNQKPDLHHRAVLLQKLETQFQLAQGYLMQAQYLHQVGAYEAENGNIQRVENYQTNALIIASAALKANRDRNGQVLNQQIERKIMHVREKTLSDPRLKDRLEDLQYYIKLTESHGWQRRDGSTRLVTVIGARWCQDTANTMDILNNFQLPTHFLVMDEENISENSYLQYSQHAYLAMRPDLEENYLSIPVVIFPQGIRMVEPSAHDLIIELVKQEII